MNRHLSQLDQLQQRFIDTVYVQLKTFKEAAELLGVNITVIRQLNKDLDAIWRPIAKDRNKWKAKKIGGDFWDFYHWIKNTEECCSYCRITPEELSKLYELNIVNKRTTRGKTLEIDRKIASEKYSNIANLTYCCYWCNNAKTDTFTEEEFKIIGKAIGTVWRQRLNNKN